jgi:hypothetical protein
VQPAKKNIRKSSRKIGNASTQGGSLLLYSVVAARPVAVPGATRGAAHTTALQSGIALCNGIPAALVPIRV